jgi:hypothetical protein
MAMLNFAFVQGIPLKNLREAPDSPYVWLLLSCSTLAHWRASFSPA